MELSCPLIRFSGCCLKEALITARANDTEMFYFSEKNKT